MAAAIGVTRAGAATGLATVLSLEVSQASLNNPPSLANPTVTLDGSLANAGTSAAITTPESVTITEQVAGTGPAVVVATATTGTSGSFAVTFGKLTATGNFTASFAGDAANGYAASTSDVVIPFANPNPGPTVTLTSVPKAQVPPGTSVTFAGKAYIDVNGAKVVPPDAIATLYRDGSPSGVTARLSATGSFALSFKPAGKNSKTNSKGAFGWQAGLIKFGHFQWQVKVAKQQVGNTICQASSSATRDSFFVDRTYVTHLVVMHLEGGTDVAAIMQDYPQAGGITYRTVTGVDKFYYLPAGGKAWRSLGSARTDGSGSVAIDVPGTLDGRFRVVFPAQGDFLGSTATMSLG
jgi:hypothetical protein